MPYPRRGLHIGPSRACQVLHHPQVASRASNEQRCLCILRHDSWCEACITLQPSCEPHPECLGLHVGLAGTCQALHHLPPIGSDRSALWHVSSLGASEQLSGCPDRHVYRTLSCASTLAPQSLVNTSAMSTHPSAAAHCSAVIWQSCSPRPVCQLRVPVSALMRTSCTVLSTTLRSLLAIAASSLVLWLRTACCHAGWHTSPTETIRVDDSCVRTCQLCTAIWRQIRLSE